MMRAPSALRATAPWLRWMLLGALMLACAPSDDALPQAPIAASSSAHAWWIRKQGPRWLLEHVDRGVAQSATDRNPVRHIAASFDDEPTRLAAFGDRVWVFFAHRERCEVVTGRADWNPASGLAFMVPAAMQLRASVPAPAVVSAAAIDDTVWVLVPDAHEALRLAGDQWRPIALPDAAQQVGRRDLCTVDDAVWLVWQGESGQARRWKRVPDAWKDMPLSLPDTAVSLRGGARMTAVVGDPRMVGRVEMGVFQALAPVPSDATVLPWGDGFAAVRVRGTEVDWAECAAGADGFSPWSALAEQRSVAGRWFHVPVLGVLSLGALMLAFLVRSVAGDAAPAVSLVIMPKVQRLLALLIDAAPAGGAALLAFDADFERLLVPPFWSLDLAEAMPYLFMTIGTVGFGAIEEAVGARSLGKRLLGGAVLGQDGVPAVWWRHVVRNLFKGLVMLSPLIAVPTVLSPRGVGVPETITRTVVVRG
jgi:uncharacterized RDD family membrane protein YckC